MPKFLLSNVKFVYTKKAIFQRVYTLYIREYKNKGDENVRRQRWIHNDKKHKPNGI